MPAAVLLSGGLDSAVVAALLRPEVAISFDYGQAHAIELGYAARLAERFGCAHVVVALPIVPAREGVVFDCRNAALASVGAMVAASHGCDRLGIGCNASDWERFPDCRPEFWARLGDAFRLAGYGVSLALPLLRKSKAEVVQLAREHGVDPAQTWSCYAPVGRDPCGVCLACETRAAAGA